MSKNRRPITRSLRALVWNTYIGESIGRSKCKCGTTISQLSFECGHVIAVSNGGETTIDNLRPICGGCNKSMGVEDMNNFFHNLHRKTGAPKLPSKPPSRYRQLQKEAKEYGIKGNLPQNELERKINRAKQNTNNNQKIRNKNRVPRNTQNNNIAPRNLQTTNNNRNTQPQDTNSGGLISGLVSFLNAIIK